MPELPEVETIVRDLSDLVTGKTVAKVTVRLNKIVRTGPRRLGRLIAGQTIDSVGRRGKHIVIGLTGDRVVVVHLKMTGQFWYGPPPKTWDKHVHLAWFFTDQTALLYRDMRQFGYFLGLTADDYHRWLQERNLGPEPLEIPAETFVEALGRRRGRIKSLLLDQSFIAGLGNIYVDESLFAAGIHPLCPADAVPPDRARRLHREMRRILQSAIDHRGSTTRDYQGLKGVGGEFQNLHQVYGKTGQACPCCGAALVRSVVGGRGTHHCPDCQLLP
jgi:formamidopyrimidine-DNA glycosylase